MSNKDALRELQSRLATRMQDARTQPRGDAWLAVESRGHGFLFPLQQAGEIFPYVPLLAVPHTHPWFAGVANLRGGLHGVVDLAVFLGLSGRPADGTRDQSRLVAFNSKVGLNCALLVDRLAGLRSAAQMSAEPLSDQRRPAFAGNRQRDGNGRIWQEILLVHLAEDPQFLAIAH
jgi:twitching motility protein PilI